MKFRLPLCLLALGLGSMVAAWPWSQKPLFEDPIKQLPRWVADLGHPWVQDHATTLATYHRHLGKDMLLEALCTTDASTFHPEGIEVPQDLFRNIKIDANELPQLASCRRAMTTMQTLSLKQINDVDELSPKLFVDILAAAPSLSRVEINQKGWRNLDVLEALLGSEITSREVDLPKLEELAIRPCIPSLVRAAPNLRVLESPNPVFYWFPNFEAEYDVKAIPRCAKHAPKLESIGVLSHDWNKRQARAVVEAARNVSRLSLYGQFPDWGSSGNDAYVFGHDLRETLNVLAELPNLENLSLPYATQLGLSWQGGGGCGNPYIDNPGLVRREARYTLRTIEEAVEIVASHLPKLKSLDIGGNNYQLIRAEHNDGGDWKGTAPLNMTWAWSEDEEHYLDMWMSW